MKNINFFKYIIISVIYILTSFNIICYAEIQQDNQSTDSKAVKSINLDDVYDSAIKHYYDIQISEYDKMIAKAGVMRARSEYFPKLNAMAGTEYTKNFRDIKESTVMSIGEAFINPYTRYQSVMGITLSYNVFDFGVRHSKLEAAKQDVLLKQLQKYELIQELRLNLIDLYTKIVILKNQIDINEEILTLEKDNLQKIQRLYKAKELSLSDVNDQKVEVEKTEQEIQELLKMYDENVIWLGFYTGEEYDSENLKVEDLKKSNIDPMVYPDYTSSLIWKLYEAQLKQKEAELKVTKRNNYPKVSAYSKYYIYGSNPNDYSQSFNDISPSNFTVGGNISMPVFDGLQNYADIKKTRLELQQLYIKRDKAIAEWMTRLAALRSNLIYLNNEIESNKSIIKELETKAQSAKRLSSKKLASPVELNNARIELLKEKIEYEKNRITANSITAGIEALTSIKGVEDAARL